MPVIATSITNNSETVVSSTKTLTGSINIPNQCSSGNIYLKSIAVASSLSTCADKISIRFTNIHNSNEYAHDEKTLSFYFPRTNRVFDHMYPNAHIGIAKRGYINIQFEIIISSSKTSFVLPHCIYFVILIDDINM